MGFAGSSGTTEFIDWAGRRFRLKSGHKILSGYANTTTNVRCTLRASGASTGYTPGAAGAKILGFKIRGTAQGSTSMLVSAGLQMGTNDVGQAASTAITGPLPVGASGDKEVSYNASTTSPGSPSSVEKHYGNGVTLAQTYYITAQVQGTASTDVIVEALIEEL